MNYWLQILIFLPLLAISQNKTIEVQLIDFTPENIPTYCGYQTEWGILKFKLNDSIHNIEGGETIFVLFLCPRETLESKLGLENISNQSNYYLSLGEKVERSKIPANTTEMFRQSGENRTPLFWMTDIEIR